MPIQGGISRDRYLENRNLGLAPKITRESGSIPGMRRLKQLFDFDVGVVSKRLA